MKGFSTLFIALVLALMSIGVSAQTVYFSQDFNATSGIALPSGWDNTDNVASTTAADYLWKTDANGYQQTRCAYITTNATFVTTCRLKSPSFFLPATDEAKISFRYKSGDDGGRLNVYVSTDNGVTYTNALATDLSSAAVWNEYEYSLSTFKGDTICIVFEAQASTAPNKTYDYYIDNILVNKAPSCQTATGLGVINVTSTSADILWSLDPRYGMVPSLFSVSLFDAAGNAIAYDPAVPGTTFYHSFTNLNPNTIYKAWVRSNCNAGFAGYADSVSIQFATNGIAINAPYYEDFDNLTTVPQGTLSENASINLAPGFAYGNTGHSLKFSITETTGSFMYFPLLNLSADNFEMDFRIRRELAGTKAASFQAGYITDISNIGTFIAIVQDSLADARWHNIRFNSRNDGDSTATMMPAILIGGGQTENIYMDNVGVHAIPSCIRPENVTATNITENSITLDWNTADATNIVITATNTETAQVTTVTATSHPYTLTGLASQTTYEITLHASCSATENSDTTDAISARTLCGIAHQVLFSEGFESLNANSVPECWEMGWTTKPSDNVKVAPFTIITDNKHAGLKSMSLVEQPTGSVSYMATQALPIDSAGKYDVSLWVYRSNSASQNERIEIWATTSPTTTAGGTLLGTIHSYYAASPAERLSGYYQYQYNIPMQGNVHIMIVGYSEEGATMSFDDLAVINAPRCRRVSAIEAKSADASNFVFGWTAGASETTWKVDYQLIKGNSAIDTASVIVTAPTCTIPNLADGSRYSISGYVTAICQPGDTAESVPFTLDFVTSCLSISTLPYTTGFESYESTSDAKPLTLCWSRLNNLTGDLVNSPYNYTSATYAKSGSASLYFRITTAAAVSGAREFAILPQLNTTANPVNTLRLKFYACKPTGASYVDVPVVVGVMTDPTDETTFVGVDTVLVTNASKDLYRAFLTNYTGNGSYIALKVETPAVGASVACFVDDLTLETTPSCADVVIVPAVTAVTDNSVTISQSDPSVTGGWSYAYGIQGSNFASFLTGDVTSGSTATISSLSPLTTYELYVRRICGAGQYGSWSEPITFTTTTVPATAPYVCGFEEASENSNWQFANGVGVNNFVIGTAPTALYEGFNALYVSADNGLSHSYNIKSATSSYAYRTFAFTNQGYKIDLKFRLTGGESALNDYARIMLIPAEKEIVGASYNNIKYPDGTIFLDPDGQSNIWKTTGNNWITTDVNNWASLTFAVDMTNRPGYYNLAILWTNNASLGTANNPIAIDNINVTTLSCLPPVNVAVTNLFSDSAVINIPTSAASQWEVAVSATNFTRNTVPDAPLYRSIVATNNVGVGNLQPNTTYYYAVRTICQAGDTSMWSAPASFTTSCTAFTLPYTEGFENRTENLCWHEMTTSSTSNISFSSVYSKSGSSSLLVESSAIVSPEMNVTTLANSYLRFWAYSRTANATINIGVMTDPNDATTYEYIGSATIANAATWTEYTQVFTLLNDPDYSDFYNARHVVISCSDASIYLDNVEIDVMATCPEPTNVTISNITSTTFDIAFTNHAANATQWIVRTNNQNHLISTNPATITGLKGATTYNVSVAAICSATDTSKFTTAISARTECAVFNLPWLCGFERDEDFTNAGAFLDGDLENKCWNTLNVRYGGRTYPTYYANTTASYVHSGTQGLYTYSSSLATSGALKDTMILIMPEFNAASNALKIKYWYKCGGTNANYTQPFIGYMTDVTDESTLTIIDLAPRLNVYTERTVMTDQFANIPANARIAIGTVKEKGKSGNGLYLDDISVYQIRSCSDPEMPEASNITSSSADISFADTCAAHTAWEYVIGERGFDPSTGTPVAMTAKTFTVAGLTPETTYDIYVRAICDSLNQSNWMRCRFTTLCGPFMISATNPYYDSFEEYATNIPVSGCYVMENVEGTLSTLKGQSNTGTTTLTIHARTGTNCIKTTCQTTSFPKGQSFFREMHLEAGKFYKATIFSRTSASDGFGVRLIYGTAPFIDSCNVVTTVTIMRCGATSYGTNPKINDNSGCYVPVEGIFTVNQTGNYYVGFNAYNISSATTNITIFHDDFTVEELTGCMPTIPTFLGSTANSATFSHSDTIESHNYEYQIIKNGEVVVNSTPVGTNPFIVSNLDHSSVYTMKIRQICDSNDYSIWQSVDFQTQCAPTTVFPYTEGFENSFPPLCWSHFSYGNPSNTWAATSLVLYVHNGSFAAAIPDAGAGGRSALVTKELNLTSPYGYKVKFWMYRQSDQATLVDEAMHVGYSHTPVTASNITDVQEIGVVNRHYLQTPAEASSGYYQYEFEIPAGETGSTYVVFDYHNQYKDQLLKISPGAAMIDDITIEEMPSCVAPKNAATMVSSTMTTATLTADAKGKLALEYQWALSTAPDAPLGTMVTSTGTATITGLAASTSYAVRYRYICAEGDTSDWSPSRIASTTATNCFAPQNLRTAGIVNDHHAALTWGAAPLAVKYEYVLRLSNVVVDSAFTTNDTVVFDSLLSTSAYSFSIRTYCADDTTAWQTVNFNTTNRTFTMPFVCDFENDTINQAWTLSNPTSGANAFVVGTDNTGVNSGTKALYVSSNGSTFNYVAGATGTMADVLLEMQPGNYYVEYDWLGVGQTGKDYGRVFLIPANASLTAITSDNYATSLPAGAISADNDYQLNLNTTWNHRLNVVNIPNEGLYRLVVLFAADATVASNPGFSIDNISVQEVNCMPVTEASIISVADSYATFKVRRQNVALDIEYGVTSYNSMDSIQTWTRVSDMHAFDTITVTGLTSSNEYHFFVRHICTETEVSSAEHITFQTTKPVIIPPYICSFEANDTTLLSWSMTTGISSNYFVIGNASSYLGSRSLYITNDGTTHGYNFTGASITYAYLPIQLDEGVYGVTYNWIGNGERTDYGRLFLAPTSFIPTDNVTFQGLSDVSVPTGCVALDNGAMRLSTAWSGYDNEINITRPGVYYLVAYWTNGAKSGNLPPLAIDDIHITPLSCHRVDASNLTVDSVDNSMIRIKIAGYDTTASFIYHLASDGTFADTIAYGQTAAGDTIITFSGLEVATLYHAHITAICAPGDTAAAASVALRTACGIRSSYPFYEDFETFPAGAGTDPTITGNITIEDIAMIESMTNDVLSNNCWYVGTASAACYYSIAWGSQYVTSGDRSLYVDNLFPNQPISVFALPFMDNVNGKSFSAMYKNTYTDPGYAVLQVGYLTVPDNYGTFVLLASAPASPTYTEFNYVFSNVPANARPAIRVYGQSSMFIDDVRINTVVDGDIFNDTVCYGNGYSGHGFEIATGTLAPGDTVLSRTFRSSVPGANDSTIYLHLHVLNQISTIYYDTICNGQPYVSGRWNIPNPQSFSYRDTYEGASVHGCDSSVVLVLTVLPTTETRYDTICMGDAYSFCGQTLTAAGTYTGYTTTAFGCPDTVTLYLAVIDTLETTSATICQGASHYFEGQYYNQTGTYRAYKQGLHNCTITAVLNLTVIPTDSTINVAICQGGQALVVDTIITTAGTYTLHRTGLAGCGLNYTIDATVDPVITGDVYTVAAAGYEVTGFGISGLTVTADTVVDVPTRTGDNHCDSITSVHIRYQPTWHTDTTAHIEYGGYITWQDETYTKAGDYSVTLHDENGCDSIVTLHVIVDGTAVDNVEMLDVTLVPNPVNAGETSFIYGNFGDVKSVEILNSFGQIVDTFVPAGYPIEVQGLNASGIYYVRVTTADDRVAVQKLIVK